MLPKPRLSKLKAAALRTANGTVTAAAAAEAAAQQWDTRFS